MNPLSLHHLTVLDAPAEALIDIAAATGCEQVCVFVHSSAPELNFPVIDRASCAALRGRMRATGVAVYNLEFFPITASTDFEVFARALRVGAELGGRRATAHIHDPDPDRAVEGFTRFCRLAAEFDLLVGLEFTAFSQCASLAAAVRLVERADQPNAALAVDALHLMRTGGSPSALAAIDPRWIGYAQICDGPANVAAELMIKEAITERRIPGEGVFPLRAILGCIPGGVTIEVEVPQGSARRQGLSALARARRAVGATRNLLTGGD